MYRLTLLSRPVLVFFLFRVFSSRLVWVSAALSRSTTAFLLSILGPSRTLGLFRRIISARRSSACIPCNGVPYPSPTLETVLAGHGFHRKNLGWQYILEQRPPKITAEIITTATTQATDTEKHVNRRHRPDPGMNKIICREAKPGTVREGAQGPKRAVAVGTAKTRASTM